MPASHPTPSWRTTQRLARTGKFFAMSNIFIDKSVNTNCSGGEVYTPYTVTTGIDTQAALRFDMVMLNWAGNMKTTTWLGRDIILPGDYFFRFVGDGNTIEVLNGKKKMRFVIISTYCTQDDAVLKCKAGEKLAVQH
jgi:hypothetical protein